MMRLEPLLASRAISCQEELDVEEQSENKLAPTRLLCICLLLCQTVITFQE